MSFKGIHHIVIRVSNLEASIQHWCETLGMKLSRTQTNEDLGVDQAIFELPEGGFIELIAPIDENSPLAKTLATRGEGLHLISMSVENVEDTLNVLQSNDVTILGAAGGPKFVHPKSASGVMLGLAQAEGN